jgi:hypothetical protein
MSVQVMTLPPRRFSFGRVVRHFLELPERRHQRYVQERAEWIAEARYGPTVQELMELTGR